MPKDIVEAYTLAVKARDSATRQAMREVIDFCENNLQCSADQSLKRNTLLLWAYKRLAASYAKAKDFAKAYELLCKASEIPAGFNAKVALGFNMLRAANNMSDDINAKATKVTHTAEFLKNVYDEAGDEENYHRMLKLQNAALRVLQQSSVKH